MHRSQANRAVIAARTTAGVRPVGRPSTDIRARVESVASMAIVNPSRKAVRLTATQRNSIGGVSEWNRSPYFVTVPAWDRTVNS
jgi:hypothetical protein